MHKLSNNIRIQAMFLDRIAIVNMREYYSRHDKLNSVSYAFSFQPQSFGKKYKKFKHMDMLIVFCRRLKNAP